ncbi:MFS transporter [Salinicola rhizosphaerae]|uniref:MFS transporter n=1 Tax=Salinicola rhizosphaerae TaxID=1443141 RepID=A0ABQ3E3U6_9GAMM|nr:MFS transporter [Salinicola rhizosphaerae]GHB21548.1 MFS transporter [Salinicola rhizosphaerae]
MTSPARLPFAVWALTLCQALLISGNVLLIAINPLIGSRLTPNADWITLPVAAQLLGLTAATLPAGWLTARLGRKRTFMLANVIGLSGIAICIFALTSMRFWLFNAGTFAIGISIGAGMLYRFAAIELVDARRRDAALALVMAGGVIAAFTGPWLARHSRHWFEIDFMGAFIGLGGLYVTALIVLSTLRFPARPANPVATADRRTTPGNHRQRLAAIVSATLGYTVMNLAMTATPLAMTQAGHAFDQVANVIQWHMLAMFAPSFFTGRLTRRFGHARMIALGAVCLLASIICALLAPALWAFGIGLLLLGLGWNFVFLPASAWLTTTHSAQEAPRVQAINDCAVFSMTTLSALLAGPLNAWLGWQWLNLCLLPLVVVLMAVGLGTSSHRRQPVSANAR